MSRMPKKIMLVAGEQSGDTLGAGLLRTLKARFPDCEFCGIGGEQMVAEGLHSYFDMERLSVMGFIDPLKRLPELLGMIRNLKKRMVDEHVDIFIGIDAPDFNIRLEQAAKKRGLYSVHYVSPSVWAWRQGRVKKIRKSVDLMLTLLPFEAEFYREHGVPVSFVGHPLADKFAMEPDQRAAREQLSLPEQGRLCALMPGSRGFEVEALLPLMLSAAVQLKSRFPDLSFVLPAANDKREEQIKSLMSDYPHPPITLVSGRSHEVMTAADCVVMASGTTTLEAMLLKRPMVITYRWPRLTWEILKRLVKVPWVGLPNLLAGYEIAPELLQDNATVENVVQRLTAILEEGGVADEVTRKFIEIHESLRCNASEQAAASIDAGWNERG